MPSHLFSEFAVIGPTGTVDLEPVDPSLYARLDAEYGGFDGHLLVSAHSFDEDWDTWEVHPAGDELVVLIRGWAQLVLQGPNGETTQGLARPGDFCLVPKGAWHTARVNQPTQLLFITPGANTSNAEKPPSSV
ncbi:MAG: cupin domain-containing protein [Pseudomonadota bacterium]|nr:cupin domain-containing protein [Pseudomonadota bacterium]